MKTKKILVVATTMVIAILVIGSILYFGKQKPLVTAPANLSGNAVISPNQSSTTASTTSSMTSASIPPLFRDYNIIFKDRTSTDTSIAAIRSRLNNTSIKNKLTGSTTPLLSPSIYGSWHNLLYSAEVMGTTLYAAIQTPIPENDQTMSIDLWKSNDVNQPILLYKNIGIFSISEDGYIAVTDGPTGQISTILNPQGSVIKTIDFGQVGFCSVPEDGEGVGLINWSGHNLWFACDYTDDSPTPTYLEINVDTFQITRNSQPPSELGM